MYHVLARVDTAPEHRAAFITAAQDLATDSLQSEAGTLGFDIIQDAGNPTRFYFHEVYADEAAFQAHMQGPVAQRTFPPILALIGDQYALLGQGQALGITEG